MKIALISPKVNFTTNIPELQDLWDNSAYLESYRKIWSSSPGTGLLTLAALIPPSHEIVFIDENIEEIDFSINYDVVGITAMTQQALRAYEIGDRFRQNGSYVIIGGIHSTLLPQEATEHADSVVIGEAEYIWPDILHDLMNNCVKPFYTSERAVDLKDSPIPRFDLLKSNTYFSISIQTSRGCPHDCEYCSSSKLFGPTYRYKTVEQIIDEVALVKGHLGDNMIFFSDDNFLVNRKYAINLLEQLSPLNINWFAQSDIAIGAETGLLELMKKSGCSSLFIGLESVTSDGLKNIDKHGWKLKQLNHYSTYIQQIQSHGIGVTGAFMVGLDSDDTSTFEHIANFVIENHLMGASITILTPVPGTRLRERYEAENRLLPTHWNNYTGYNVNHKPKRMSVEDLEKGLLYLYETIYNEEVYLDKLQYFTELAVDRRKKRKLEQCQL